MSAARIVLLGAIAGFTIFLGLPVGRTRRLGAGWRTFLNALATGILVFILWDVLSNGIEPVNRALTAASSGHGSWWRFSGLAAVFAGALVAGAIALVYYDRWTHRRWRRVPRPSGPGAATLAGLGESVAVSDTVGPRLALSPAKHLALMIAIGIGFHNFGEGLAIGQSAAKGQLSLALLLVIGFGLHNATEGFGIVAPMAGETDLPSWAFLAVLGLVGGGPTFLGTLVGRAWVNDAVYAGFLALAAGSILYVIVQLLHVAAKLDRKELLMWGLLLGMLAGFATDMVLTAAGA